MSKKTIHLFHSIKGGAGKSANAFFYAIRMEYYNNKSNIWDESNWDQKKPRVLLIDADLKGTSFFKYWNGEIFKSKNPPPEYCKKDDIEVIHNNSKRHFFYSDAIIHNRKITIDNCVSRLFHINDASDQTFGCDVAFCNPHHESKKAFIPNTSKVDGLAVKPSFFQQMFSGFLEDVLDDSRCYSDVVIDMSPGLDEYMQCILNICFDLKFQDKLKVDVVLHAITTVDKAHMNATMEYISDIYIKNKMTLMCPSETRIIINEIRQVPKVGRRNTFPTGLDGQARSKQTYDEVNQEFKNYFSKTISNQMNKIKYGNMWYIKELNSDELIPGNQKTPYYNASAGFFPHWNDDFGGRTY